MSRPRHDPYALDRDEIQQPPRRLGAILRKIGPGLILAATVVGSGELIATTVLGAETGYLLLWLILLSCAVKVFVQHEIGRYTIGSGETTLEAFDRTPGPRLGVSWLIWLWTVMVASLMFSIGGMLGAIGEVLGMFAPDVPLEVWIVVVSAATLTLLWVGRYGVVEKAAIALVGALTAMTLVGAILLVQRPELFSWGGVLGGMAFRLPEGGLSTAITVFGATGVGAAELATYPYWCLEKGYARFTGPRDASPEWTARARGWIRVMSWDVGLSLVVYTIATIAFFLLGASVLHSMATIPQGVDTIRTLTSMYTETLGEWSRPIFLLGSVAVLYSTAFALTAAYTRLVADFAGMLGVYDRHNYRLRLRATRIALAAFLILPCFTFYFIRDPVVMVKVSGITQAVLLPLLGFATLYVTKRHLAASIAAPRWVRLALWITSGIMAAMMVGSVYLTLR